MLSIPRWAAVAASLLLLSQQTVAVPTPELGCDVVSKRADENYHWVATWTSMPQLVESSNMPPSPFVRTSPFAITRPNGH